MSLEVLWYFVVIVSMIAYAVLDGFDLGVGVLHLFTKKDDERRIFLNAIGPVWDGNEVWLVIIGGALFAGFPDVYASSLSAFYNLVMLLLCGLIFRAVAIEFRSKRESMKWRNFWDRVFSIASIVIAFGLGVALGNLIQGISLDANHDFVGHFTEFFTPYTLMMGLTTLVLFTMHGAIYLTMKTEGALHNKVRVWVNYGIVAFIIFYLILTAATFVSKPHMTERMLDHPWLFGVGFLALLAIANIPWQIKKRNDGWAFLSSCLSIALLLALFSIGTFPVLMRSSIDPENFSLTAFNSASSHLTLTVLLIIVAIGIPLVLAYGFYIYRVFRGKVTLDKASY